MFVNDDIEFEYDVNPNAFDLDLEVTTTWKAKLRPSDDKWFLEGRSFDFVKFGEWATDEFVRKAKITSACRAQRCAATTICNDLNRLKNLVRYSSETQKKKIDSITVEHLLSWRSYLKKENECELGALKSYLIESCLLIGNGLVDEESVEYLENSEFKGNIKGARVNDMDQGRLSRVERAIFENKARQAFESKILDGQEFLMLILLNSFGMRLIDFISLKVKDAHFEWEQGVLKRAVLDIPCGKAGSEPRSKMAKGNIIDPSVAPLLYLVTQGRNYEQPLFDLIYSDARRQEGVLEGHLTHSTVSIYLYRAIQKLKLGFNLNSYRFRYTVGTETYRETGNPYVSAYILRHSDIQNVRVYTNEIVLAQAHDRVVEHVFSDITSVIENALKIKSFAGVVISKQNFEQGKLLAVRAREQIGKFDPIGGCAGKLSCHQGAPVACYCCKKFRPIREADHLGMLKSTIAVYLSTAKTDSNRAACLVPAIFGMAQVCHLTREAIGSVEV